MPTKKPAPRATKKPASKPKTTRAAKPKLTVAAPKPNLATGQIDVSGAATAFAQMLALLAGQAPSKDAVAIYRSFISDADALHDGVGISSDKVIADAMVAFAASVPSLLEQPLPGYGPKRAYYGVGLALAHAEAYQSFLAVEASKATASSDKTASVKSAREGRSYLHGLLGEVAHGDDGLGAGIAKAAHGGTQRAGAIAATVQGLASLGDGLVKKGAKKAGLGEVLDDMGITSEAIAAIAAKGRALTSATQTHSSEQTAIAAESDALNTFDGRVWFELEALARAATRARKDGRVVPEVKLANIGRVHHRRRAPAAGAPAGATPVAGAPSA